MSGPCRGCRRLALLVVLLAAGCSRPDSGITEAEGLAEAARVWEETRPSEAEFLQGFGPAGYCVARQRLTALRRDSNATPERRAVCARNGSRELRAVGLTWQEIQASFKAIRQGRRWADIACPHSAGRLRQMKPAVEARFLREGLYLRWDERPPAPETDAATLKRYKVWYSIYSRMCDEADAGAISAQRPAAPPWQDSADEPEPEK